MKAISRNLTPEKYPPCFIRLPQNSKESGAVAADSFGGCYGGRARGGGRVVVPASSGAQLHVNPIAKMAECLPDARDTVCTLFI